MTTKERKIDDWAMAAYKALDKDWEGCDDGANSECRGVRCANGAHRAIVYIHRILDEVAQ